MSFNDVDEGRAIEVVHDESSGLTFVRVIGPERIKVQQVALDDDARRALIETLDRPYDHA